MTPDLTGTLTIGLIALVPMALALLLRLGQTARPPYRRAGAIDRSPRISARDTTGGFRDPYR